MLESKIQSQIIRYLEANGWYCIKLIKTNKNGIPDIVAVKLQDVIFIEVKTDKGVVSELQKYRIKELNDIGIKAVVVRSLQSFKQIFCRLENKV